MECHCFVHVYHNLEYQKDFFSMAYALQEDIEDKTISLWTWLNVSTMANPDKFINLRYKESQQQR